MNGAESIRTADRPLAFTRAEFWRGAWTAWGCFLLLLVIAELVVTVIDELRYTPQPNTARISSASLLILVIPTSILIAAPVSAVAMLLFAPLVRRIAWRMRGVGSPSRHVAVHAVLGAAVGILTVLAVQLVIFLCGGGVSPAGALVVYCAFAALLTSASTAIGWWRSLRCARRADEATAAARRIQHRLDVDVAFEDEALDR